MNKLSLVTLLSYLVSTFATSCISDDDCLLTEECSISTLTCETSDYITYIIIGVSVYGGIILLFSLFTAFYFPLRDPDGENMRLATFAATFFIPFIYFMLLGYQNPIRTPGTQKPNFILTFVIALFVPVVLFFLIPRDGWRRVPTSAKVSYVDY